MNLDLDSIFTGGRVPDWLRGFDANPGTALHDLLLGRAELGHLSVANPVDLLLGWLHAFGDQGGFTDLLDQSLTAWITDNWGRVELANGSDSATLTSAAWTQATELLAAAPSLTQAGKTLTQYVLSDQRYLNSLTEGRSRDPQAGAWFALASHQHDRTQLQNWWRLCDLPPDEPWYRGHCGIAGLRALPPESKAFAGGFPKELAEGLNRLGLSLWRHQDEGWLDGDLAREEFQDSLRLTLGAYPFPDRWLSFWRHVLRRDHRRGDIRIWVRTLLPRVGDEIRDYHLHSQQWASYDPGWADRAKAIAEDLVFGTDDAVKEAEQLLSEQYRYFEHSGNCSNLVRSATYFSRSIRSRQPAQALTWARLAKEVEPWNGYAWTNEGESLRALGEQGSALEVYREAATRFPDDVVVRNGLAEVLKAQDRLPEAEAEYRETIERFPDNVFTRSGLAEVLKAQERLPEAEAEYRETIERFPDDMVARNGLAEVLKAQDRLPEAEAEYRETKSRFPGNLYVRTGLAAVLDAQGRHHEAEEVRSEGAAIAPDQTGPLPLVGAIDQGTSADQASGDDTESPAPADLVPGSSVEPMEKQTHGPSELSRREVQIIAGNAFLVRGWARATRQYAPDMAEGLFRERADQLLTRLLPVSDNDSLAAGESALLELDRGELEQAQALLRRAVQRFPGSARVRYALARAEREATDGDPVTPWRRLLRLDDRYQPIFYLGSGRASLNRIANLGDRAKEDAQEKLGRLAFWIRERIELVEGCGLDAPGSSNPRACYRPRRQGEFAGWWAVEAQAELFGTQPIAGYDDLSALDSISEHALANSAKLDRLEEEFVMRYARA